MNILHISRTMGQGGAEKIVYQLATGLKGRTRKTYVASSGGCYAGLLEEQGISHYQIADPECKKPWVILKNLFRLCRIVRKESIDIVHTHHRMAAVYAYMLRILNPGIRLVYTAHNVFYDKKILTKKALGHTAVVAVGNSVKENLTDYFHISPEKIVVIHNAVKPETPEKKYRNRVLDKWKEQGFRLLGIIGRLSEQKGIDIFLRVVAELKKKNCKIRGIIIGDGELKGELIREAYELGLENEVLFLGYQEHVSTLITQLDLILMPSRWEGFPLTPLEVFAEKKTIVGSNIGGISEIITDGQNGRLVMKDNVPMFTEAVAELLCDSKLRMKMEDNGYEYYSRNFSYDSFMEEYVRLYENVLQKGKI